MAVRRLVFLRGEKNRTGRAWSGRRTQHHFRRLEQRALECPPALRPERTARQGTWPRSQSEQLHPSLGELLVSKAVDVVGIYTPDHLPPSTSSKFCARANPSSARNRS